MRYSFHGKVRATGQQVDGYVEAETSSEAIDRLADQGIIGVYSVRAEPKQPRNPVLLAGTPEFERSQFADADGAARKSSRRYLPAPVQPPPPPAPAELPQLVAPPPQVIMAAPAPGSVTDATMLALVEKLSQLIVGIQKVLDRPAQVVYASGPAREGKGGGGGGKRASSRNVSDAQNSTLKDIFQNNLDLRRSLQKLADTVTPSAQAAPAADGVVVAPPSAEPVAWLDSTPAPDQATAEMPADGGPIEATVIEAHSAPLAGGDDDGDMPLRVHDSDHARQSQPAA